MPSYFFLYNFVRWLTTLGCLISLACAFFCCCFTVAWTRILQLDKALSVIQTTHHEMNILNSQTRLHNDHLDDGTSFLARIFASWAATRALFSRRATSEKWIHTRVFFLLCLCVCLYIMRNCEGLCHLSKYLSNKWKVASLVFMLTPFVVFATCERRYGVIAWPRIFLLLNCFT